MDDKVRVANTGEMDDHGTVDNAGERDDHMAVAKADDEDDHGVINDASVKYVPFNWKGLNKPENTDFTVKTWKEDLTLLVENKKLYVSKAILGLVSPVFDRMFQSEFKEGHQTEIELPDKKLDDVKEFLRCIYPNMENGVSEKNVYTILPLADEYQVTSLKTKCEDLLKKFLEKNSHICEIYRVLNVASRYNIQLMEEGLELASRRSLEDLECAEKEVPISPETKSIIHRKVIENLQRDVDSVKKELQTVKTLNNFHRASLPKFEQLSTEDFCGWEGVSERFVLDLEGITRKYYRSEPAVPCDVIVNICGVRLACIFKVNYERNERKLLVSITPVNMNGVKRISLVLKIVLIKALKSDKDFYKILKEDISPRNTSTPQHLITLNEKEIFSHVAKVDSEIHVLAYKGRSLLYDHFSGGYPFTG